MSDIDWKKFRARDWLGAAATVFALAVTFNAEYEIAIAVHIHPLVAYAVPGALDVYVLRALQVKRDVFLTVLAMVAVNAASHLVTAGVLRVSPALIVAVSAIAPLVLWRAHVLRHEKRTEARPVLVNAAREWGEHEIDCMCLVCLSGTNPAPRAPEHTPDAATWTSTLDEHADQAISVTSTGAVNVPEHEAGTDDFDQVGAAWFGIDPAREGEPVQFFTRRRDDDGHVFSGLSDWDGNIVDKTSTQSTYDTDHRARVLSLVPPLPAGFEHVLADGDKEFLDRARDLVINGSTPSLRGLKTYLGVGNDRARRIKQYLESEHKGAQS